MGYCVAGKGLSIDTTISDDDARSGRSPVEPIRYARPLLFSFLYSIDPLLLLLCIDSGDSHSPSGLPPISVKGCIPAHNSAGNVSITSRKRVIVTALCVRWAFSAQLAGASGGNKRRTPWQRTEGLFETEPRPARPNNNPAHRARQ